MHRDHVLAILHRRAVYPIWETRVRSSPHASEEERASAAQCLETIAAAFKAYDEIMQSDEPHVTERQTAYAALQELWACQGEAADLATLTHEVYARKAAASSNTVAVSL